MINSAPDFQTNTGRNKTIANEEFAFVRLKKSKNNASVSRLSGNPAN